MHDEIIRSFAPGGSPITLLTGKPFAEDRGRPSAGASAAGAGRLRALVVSTRRSVLSDNNKALRPWR